VSEGRSADIRCAAFVVTLHKGKVAPDLVRWFRQDFSCHERCEVRAGLAIALCVTLSRWSWLLPEGGFHVQIP
jgi:hypothetical protein